MESQKKLELKAMFRKSGKILALQPQAMAVVTTPPSNEGGNK